MCIHNDNDWSFPENDEQLFVEFMVSDVTSSLIKVEEKTKNETGDKAKMEPTRSQESTLTKRKRTSASSKSSTGEPSKKKQKGKNGSRPSLTTKGFKRHFAKHDYHDYARVKPSQFELDNIKASRGGVHNPFPAVLHGMMEQASGKGYSDIISWQPHGRAFLIRDPKAFVEKVLPKYFKHSKLSSFQRQLSLYGFVRLTHDGTDRGAYYHECFLRGRPFLCSKINRTRVKGTWVRTSSSPESEPDFYTMEPVIDLDEIDSQSASRSSGSVTASSNESDDESGSGSSSEEEEPTPSLVTSQNDKSKSGSSQPVTFLDMLQSIDSAEFRVLANEPPAHAGLQPPPAFPTHVIGLPPKVSETPVPKPPKSSSADDLAPASKAYWPPKLPAIEIQSLTLLGAISYPSLDDHELAQFLTDVDLDTDFDTDDVMQMVTV